MENDKKQIAKIENDFIFKAHYALSAVEQKLILHLVSRLDPLNDKNFAKQIVPIRDIERALWEQGGRTSKVGNVYEYLQEVTGRLIDRKIFFNKEVIIKKQKIYGGFINWFQSILVLEHKGQVCIEFMFSERMKPFLLQLNEYVKINAMEVMDMRGKHSIRMYQIFKAKREQTKKHAKYEVFTPITYGLDDLKAMLGIGGKYKVLKNFRRRVLEPIETEINEYSNEISISFDYIKTRRKVTGIEFKIFDKVKPVQKLQNVDYIPSTEDLEKLTWAKRNAYDKLLEFGVKEGIAIRQIIEKVKGGEMEGYEDLFIEKALEHFKKWSKQQKNAKQSVGTFVNWWTKKKVFDIQNDVFFKIVEAVNVEKKKMEQERIDNRRVAKDMPKAEFMNWYKAQKEDN